MTANPNKDILLERLSAVQDSINKRVDEKAAFSVVETAEETVTQADVEHAKESVEKLSSSTTKENLLNRLDKVQNKIDDAKNLKIAIEAITTAESKKESVHINYAERMVAKLLETEQKRELEKRVQQLNEILAEQKKLEKAEELVEKGKKMQSQKIINQAWEVIETLDNSEKKHRIQNALIEIQNTIDKELAKTNLKNKAIELVRNAESEKSWDSINQAQDSLDTLDPSTEKEELDKKLNLIRQSIKHKESVDDAIQLVDVAETKKDPFTIERARKKIGSLEDNELKTKLSNRIQTIQDKKNNDYFNESVATLVESVEAEKTQELLDKAYEQVEKLKKSEKKNNFLERLDIVQEKINSQESEEIALNESLPKEGDTKFQVVVENNAERAVNNAESAKDQPYIDYAREKVESMENTEEKKKLVERLDQIQWTLDERKRMIIADLAIREAERTEQQMDVDFATEKVFLLSESEKKSKLQARLRNIQSIITQRENERAALEFIEEAEKTEEQAILDRAFEKIGVLNDSNLKADLNKRAENVQAKIRQRKNEINAKRAVQQAEATEMQEEVHLAKEKIQLLVDLNLAHKLTKQLNQVQDRIDYREKEERAVEAVRRVEKTKKQTDLDEARDLIQELRYNDQKKTLIERLDTIQELIDIRDKENIALAAVRIAEMNKTSEDAAYASELISHLSNPDVTIDLNKRLSKVHEEITYLEKEYTAEETVSKAEKQKTQGAITEAWLVVKDLAESDAKIKFSERLQNLQKIIDQRTKIYLIREHLESLPSSEEKRNLLRTLDKIEQL